METSNPEYDQNWDKIHEVPPHFLEPVNFSYVVMVWCQPQGEALSIPVITPRMVSAIVTNPPHLRCTPSCLLSSSSLFRKAPGPGGSDEAKMVARLSGELETAH